IHIQTTLDQNTQTAIDQGLLDKTVGGSTQTANVTPHAAGGVVSMPTYFRAGGGGGHLMGGAGAGALLPLAQVNGMLGVRATGGSSGTTINIDARGAAAGVENLIQAALDNFRSEVVDQAVSAMYRERTSHQSV